MQTFYCEHTKRVLIKMSNRVCYDIVLVCLFLDPHCKNENVMTTQNFKATVCTRFLGFEAN